MNQHTKTHLCQCNNCGTIMIDENPQTNAVLHNLIGGEVEMAKDKDGFWACPKCLTDSYLTDHILRKEPSTEQPLTETQFQELESILEDSRKFVESMTERIDTLSNSIDFKKSSQLSFIPKRLAKYLDDLEHFKSIIDSQLDMQEEKRIDKSLEDVKEIGLKMGKSSLY